ncbi:ankyrin repeat domain-containing protein [Legionella lytica]|uniref:Ankyrin repeat domain-containing protein n=1 Tax=Legionella lytica TaxID=96232 RepID=A0ABW8D363_9GAMM
MKESTNPLYRLLNEKQQAFMKGFRVQSKNSLDYGPYHMLDFAVTRNKVRTALGEFTPVDAHISIYEEDKREVGHSAFHLTANLENNVGDEYCAHIYYSQSGDYIFHSFRDGQNKFYELKAVEGLLSFDKNNIQQFLSTLKELQREYHNKYSTLVNTANNLSKSLESNVPNKKTLERYKDSVSDLIQFINSGTFFNQDHLASIKIHEDLLEEAQLKINSLHTAARNKAVPVIKETPVQEPSLPAASKSVETESTSRKIDELNKKIVALSQKRKSRTPSLILQENDLYKQKLTLLQKSDSSSSKKSAKKTNHQDTDNEFMMTLNKVTELQEEINRCILDILKDNKRYSADTKALHSLISSCSIKTNVVLQTVVECNRGATFEYLVAQRKDIDVNAVSASNASMLEIAYKKHHFEMFKQLLQNKASPDVICSNKNSLLYCACEEGRFKEMELLLEAGANPLLMNADGFNPFGALVFKQPQIDLLALFLRHAPDALNQKQGKKNQKRSPLASACEAQWDAGVSFFLDHSADSNIKGDDGLTALGVCVANNNLKLFKMILEKSKISLTESLHNALDTAVFLKQKKDQNTEPFIEEIRRYNDTRQLETQVPEFMDAASRIGKMEQSKAPNSLYSFFQSMSKYNKILDNESLFSLSKQ